MKYSTKLSDAVHVLALIAIHQDDFDLSSTSIAVSVQTNPGCIRQIMMKLRQAGLMSSVAGHVKPTLAKPAEQISLLDIYKAVEGNKPLLHLDTHTNPECGVGMNIQFALQDYYDQVQQDAEISMSKISLQDIIHNFENRTRSISLDSPSSQKELK